MSTIRHTEVLQPKQIKGSLYLISTLKKRIFTVKKSSQNHVSKRHYIKVLSRKGPKLPQLEVNRDLDEAKKQNIFAKKQLESQNAEMYIANASDLVI